MRFDQLERSLKSSFSAVRQDIEHVKHAQQKETILHATRLKELQDENRSLRHSLAELKNQLDNAQHTSLKLAENLNDVEDTFKKRIEVTLDELHAELQSKEQQKKQAKAIGELQRKLASLESLREHVERSSVDYRVLENTFLSKQDFRTVQKKHEHFVQQSVLRKDFLEQKEVFGIQLQQLKTEFDELEEGYQELTKNTTSFTLKKDHEQQSKEVMNQLQNMSNRLQTLKETQQQLKHLATDVDSLKKKHESVNLQALQKEVQHLSTEVVSKDDVLEELEKTNTTLQSLKKEVELVDEMHQTVLELKEKSASKKEIDTELWQLNDRITQLMETIRKGVQEYTAEPEMVAAQTTLAAKMTTDGQPGVARRVGNAILDFFTEEVELEVSEDQAQRKEKNNASPAKKEQVSRKHVSVERIKSKKDLTRKKSEKKSETQPKESWIKRVGKSFSHFFTEVVEDEDETLAETKLPLKKTAKKPKPREKAAKKVVTPAKQISTKDASSKTHKPSNKEKTLKRDEKSKKDEKLPKGWKKVDKVKRVGKDAPYYYQDE